MELQLYIYELAVVEDTDLSCTCIWDSTWFGRQQAFLNAREVWDTGEKGPPQQPGLTRTCRTIRAEALPLFYRQNVFRAGYFRVRDVRVTSAWLRAMGPANRSLLRHFYFMKETPFQDTLHPRYLKRLKRSPIVRDLSGMIESIRVNLVIWHHVTFGMGGMNESTYEGLALLFDGSSAWSETQRESQNWGGD